MTDSTWRPSAADPLLILAMDHRESLGRTVFGVRDDAPTPDQTLAIEAAKRLTYAGLAAVRDRLPVGRPGVLVDERYGSDVITTASADGVVLAVPVERSGRTWFECEDGEDWADHVRGIGPAYAKVLVRDNPDLDAEHRRSQLADVSRVSGTLHTIGVPLMVELLVPATEAQLAAAGSPEAYDRDLRPELVTRVIADNQAAGVEPAIWKVEGLETVAAAEEVVRQARTGGRDDVDAIVLGRDAPVERLEHWLTVAAGVDGFVGFAIGRSIWEQPVTAHAHGEIDEATVTRRVGENYLHYATWYAAALG